MTLPLVEKAERNTEQCSGVRKSSQAIDLPLDEVSFVFVDLEMTGLNPKKDRICEIGFVHTKGREIQSQFVSFVQPGISVGDSHKIHGINDEQLQDAPTFGDVMPTIRGLLESAILVGHGVESDVAFFQAEFERASSSPPNLVAVDTLPLARRAIFAPSHTLVALTELLKITHNEPHRALHDAHATMKLFWYLVEQLGTKSVRDIFNVRVGEKIPRPEIIRRATDAVSTQQSVNIKYRPSRGPMRIFHLVITAVQLEFNPPRVIGYEVEGRGRQDLRVDRIVAIEVVSI